MKYYSVSLPVSSHVVVLVRAESPEQAETIAEKAARLADAEVIDFIFEPPDVQEIDEPAKHAEVWGMIQGKACRLYAKQKEKEK